MNRGKAKFLRAQARVLATRTGSLELRWTDSGIPITAVYPAGHYRRIYKDLKRAAKR